MTVFCYATSAHVSTQALAAGLSSLVTGRFRGADLDVGEILKVEPPHWRLRQQRDGHAEKPDEANEQKAKTFAVNFCFRCEFHFLVPVGCLFPTVRILHTAV